MSKDKPREAVTEALRIQRHLETQEKLEAPYEKALGKLTIRFSLLHITLEQFAWSLWSIKGHLASIITKDLPTTHLVEKLRSSAQWVMLATKDRKDFLSILKKVESVASKRNELLHSLWIIRAGQPIHFFSRKRGSLIGADAPSVEGINQLNGTIAQIIGELMELQERKPLLGLFGFGLSAIQPGDELSSVGATLVPKHPDTP